MAAKKTPPIEDVKDPDKVATPPTARPIVVSDHPEVPRDPMVVDEEQASADGDVPSAPLISHTAKTIAPLSEPDQAADTETGKAAADKPDKEALKVTVKKAKPAAVPKDEVEPADASEAAEAAPAAADSPEPAATPPQATETAAAPPESAPAPAAPEAPAAEPSRDAEAATAAAAAEAQTAAEQRRQELDALIASHKYAVPINAVQRRRSRIVTGLLLLLALVLLVFLADILLDVRLVHLPFSVPHTHFFVSR